MQPDAIYILITALLLVMNSSIIGALYVAGRNSLFSDAISHAVLPGIVLAYISTKTRNSIVIITGALISALAATGLIQYLHKRHKIHYDAALGSIYTFFFAVGIILISIFAGSIDLDQDCVLYGEIAFIPFDSFTIHNTSIGPKAMYIQLGLSAILSLLVFKGRTVLILLFFNEDFAKTHGIPVKFPLFIIHIVSAIVVIINFDLVGAILVVAFMIIPACASYLTAKNFNNYLINSMLFGILGVAIGFILATISGASYSGSFAIGCMVVFLFALLLSTKRKSKPSIQSN